MDGIDTSPEGIEEVRKHTIDMRDFALKQGELEWAVILSHNIAMLADYKAMKEAQNVA